MRKYIYYSVLSLTLASCTRNPLVTKSMANSICYPTISKDYLPEGLIKDMETAAAFGLIDDHKDVIGSEFGMVYRDVEFISDDGFDKIGKIVVSYSIDKKVQHEEARRIFIDVLEKFIACADAEERFKDYLIDGKFTRKNITLSINFWDDEYFLGYHNRCEYPYITSVQNNLTDEIAYLFYDNTKKEYLRDKHIFESYDTAKEIVLTEQASEKKENLL